MDPIFNSEQQATQLSAKSIAPHQQNICSALAPNHDAAAQQNLCFEYDSRQQQQNHDLVYNHATLTLPQNSHIATSTNSNKITLVSCDSGGNNMFQSVMAFPSQSAKLLGAVNEVIDAASETTEDINSTFSRAVANRAVFAKSLPFQPHKEAHTAAKQDVKPFTAVNEVIDDVSETTEDINSAFSRAIAKRLPYQPQKKQRVSTEPLFNSDATSVSTPVTSFVPATSTLIPASAVPCNSVNVTPPELIKEAAPTSIEQTSIVLEGPQKIAAPEQKIAPLIVLEELQNEIFGIRKRITEDINSAFSRTVASLTISAKNVVSQPQDEEHIATQLVSTEHSFNSGAASVTTLLVTSFAPPASMFIPEPAVPFIPANVTASELMKEATPNSMKQTSILLEGPQSKISSIEKGITEIPQEDNRVSLIHEYEKKIDELVHEPKILEELSKKVYNRKLIQLLREINKDFHHVPCPLSEQELKRIGIDRATMPSSANFTNKPKYRGRRGYDLPNDPWARRSHTTNVRSPKNARENQDRDRQIKNQPIQNQKFKTLVRGPNAWVSDVMNVRSVADPESVEVRIAKVRKNVQGILNKITPTTANDFSVEMVNKLIWRDEDSFPAVAELIFIKAIEEPIFVGLYSDLCSSLHKAEQNMEKESFKRHIQGAIVRKIQSSFEITALSQFQETISKIKKEIKEEEECDEKDDKKLADLNERFEQLKAKEKRRMLSTIKFMSHLFRIELLNYKIIENCIVILIRNAEQSGSELMTEYAVELMKHGGPFIVERKEDTSKLDGYVTYLDKLKSSVSNRVKFMIMDLTDLRDKKWVDKRVGPKTKDEVDMYIQKKLEQNKREQIVIEQDRKRSKDDKKARANAAAADQHRKRSNFIDKQRQTYVSRLSVDKKDRLNAAAAAAASASASGSALKNTSLLKIDKLRLGSTKKWGNPNTNTTSSTPSQNDKSASRVMARQSADARYNT